MSKRIVLLVDMDSVIADINEKWYTIYNALWNDDLTVERVKSWDTDQWVKPECGKDIFKILKLPGFFSNLNPIPGAKAALKRLYKAERDGERVFDIYIVTAATASKTAPQEKMDWMAQHFPFIDQKHIICAYNKALVKGDVLIDDGPRNLADYAAAWPEATLVTIDYPYNQGAPCTLRAEGWKNLAAAWDEIEDFLTEKYVKPSDGTYTYKATLVVDGKEVESLSEVSYEPAPVPFTHDKSWSCALKTCPYPFGSCSMNGERGTYSPCINLRIEGHPVIGAVTPTPRD